MAVLNPGRLGPHSIEAEEALLGALLMDVSALAPVRALVRSGDFFELKHNWLYAAICALFDGGQAVDNVTLVDELRRRGQLDDVGGSAYVTYLINSTPTFLHAETYARIVQTAALRRQLMDAAGAIAQAAREDGTEIDGVLLRAQEALSAVAKRASGGQLVDGAMLADEAMNEAHGWLMEPADTRGLKTGFPGLDRILGGLEPGVMLSIGGDTGMGKSTFAGALVRAFALQGRGLLLTTETMPKTAFHKFAGDMAGIPYKDVRRGRLSQAQAEALMSAYVDLVALGQNVVVWPGLDPNPLRLQAEVLRLQDEEPGCLWVVVDSGSKLADGLQAESDYARVTAAAHALQNVALEGVVVGVTWQIGRSTKERDVKLPRLHDFKNSGAVEENTDVALGLYRHDYYVGRGMAKPDPAAFPAGTARIMVLKDRRGAAGDEFVTLGFQPGKGFYEIELKAKKPF